MNQTLSRGTPLIYENSETPFPVLMPCDTPDKMDGPDLIHTYMYIGFKDFRSSPSYYYFQGTTNNSIAVRGRRINKKKEKKNSGSGRFVAFNKSTMAWRTGKCTD